jgi:hypothetical protein
MVKLADEPKAQVNNKPSPSHPNLAADEAMHSYPTGTHLDDLHSNIPNYDTD